ncbi:MAG TPA: hypothetical protein VK698_14005 [Kofleriaceae bacterium]|nr:hypothetical protein [Kofleriaceae bacterium]
MVDRVMRAISVFALLHALAAGLAGCSTSVEGNPTPVGGEAGDGEGDLGPGTDGDGLGGDADCSDGFCSVYEQCGCDPGQACDLDGAALDTGATECREVSSPGQTQSNCEDETQCAAGYSCLGEPGQCRKMCDEDRDCGIGRCIVEVVFENDSGELEAVPNANACTKQCRADSAGQSGCPGDPALGCRFYSYDDEDGASVHYTDCTTTGAGGDAADCSAASDSDCQPGFGCFVITYDDDTQADECRQICAVSIDGVAQSNQCAVGTCHGFDPAALVSGTEYGACF